VTKLLLVTVLVVVAAGGVAAQGADPFDTERLPELTLSDIVRVGDGSDQMDYLFDRIQDVAVLSPDVFAVVDGGSNEVRAYDSNGTLVWKVGGEGDGPGEFRSASRLTPLPNGRFLVWDGGTGRATTFGADRSVLATATADFGPMATFTARFVSALTDGSWIQRIEVSPLELRDEPEGTRRDSVRFVHVSADGATQRNLATILGPERYLAKHSSITWERLRLVLGSELVVAVRSDTLFVATTDSMTISRFEPSIGVLSPLRIQRPVREAVRSAQEAERSRLLAAAEPPTESSGQSLPGMNAMMSGRVKALREMPAKASYPAFSDLLIGGDGKVWIKEYRTADDEDSELWYRMGPDLRPDGWTLLPEEEELAAVGHGLFISVATDEYGVQTIVVRSAQ